MTTFAKHRFSLLILVFAVLILVFTNFAFAEEIDLSAVASHRAQLEQDLKKLEAQIDGYQTVIQGKQKEASTFERDIAILDAQIAKAKLEIKVREIEIIKLSDNIAQHSEDIKNLSGKIENEQNSLAELIRKISEMDSNSPVEFFLGYERMSDFFVKSDSFEIIQQAIQESLNEVRGTKELTEKEKTELEEKKMTQIELKSMQELERKQAQSAEAYKKKVLAATKGEEAKYQKFLNDTQKNAANIRSRLFLLSGSPSIPFEKAVEYAVTAWKATNVRPAFLLGVITEESNLGANIGKGNWKTDMAHSACSKQRTAFIAITSELGLDPNLMPVSKKAWYGNCGGAMGPAQFMPMTWQLYKNLISNATGHNPPSPWSPEDAFAASALLLKDNGGAGGVYANERKAALKYLAGGNWSKKAYAFYGDDVMTIAAKYQEQIDIINR